MPVLFSRAGEDGYHAHPEIMDFIKKWNIKNIIIVGGYSTVTEFIEVQLKYDEGLNTVRLYGKDRYSTSLAIAQYFANGETYDSIALATGEDYPDALAGATFACKNKCAMLLVDKDSVSDDIKSYISRINPEEVFILGGDGVVSSLVLDQLLESK
jgi:putative cell wall-binding protein